MDVTAALPNGKQLFQKFRYTSVRQTSVVPLSYLSSITHKVFALVTPNPLRCHHKHQDPEHKHHGQPDPPERSGVFIDSTQQTLQS